MSQAKSAFRGLLRAAKELCGNDKTNLRRAKAEIRSHFDKSRNVRDTAEIEGLLNDAREAEDFIQRNLVQARMTRPGTFSVKLKDPDAPNGDISKEKHVDFEPMAPQVAIEKTLNPAQSKKAPAIKQSSSPQAKCCSSHGTHGHSH